MIDHIGFSVPPSKYDEVIAFYEAILAPLGYAKQREFPGAATGFGPSKKSAPFWIASKEDAPASGKGHFAFQALDHAAVEGFHAAGLKAGGTDNGEPGIREQYHPNFYGAYIIDPVG